MKNRSTISIFIGVLLCVLALVNVYHFAASKQPGNAVIATISGIAGGSIIGTAAAVARLRNPSIDKRRK